MSILKFFGIENTTHPSHESGTTQNQMIMEHLRSGKSISQIEALNLYGCLRLSARIKDLRKQGHLIETLRIPSKGSTYARYKLVKEAQNAG